MRKIFNKELLKIAAERKNVYMILADIGYGEIEPFANTFPDRFINCGVAEQEMTGVACGVAMEGRLLSDGTPVHARNQGQVARGNRAVVCERNEKMKRLEGKTAIVTGGAQGIMTPMMRQSNPENSSFDEERFLKLRTRRPSRW